MCSLPRSVRTKLSKMDCSFSSTLTSKLKKSIMPLESSGIGDKEHPTLTLTTLVLWTVILTILFSFFHAGIS